MKRKNKNPHLDPVTQELLSKGKDVVNDFDESQGIYVLPRNPQNKLISIRLPMDMIRKLREVARARGDIGYQQVIKTYIADGLAQGGQTPAGHFIKSDQTVYVIGTICSTSNSTESQQPYVAEAEHLINFK